MVEEAGLRSLILGGALALGHCGVPQHPLNVHFTESRGASPFSKGTSLP